MKVKLMTTYAGPRGTWMAGTEVDFPDAEAKRLVSGGYAELVEVAAQVRNVEVETATVEAPEKAVTRSKDKRRRG